MKKRMQNKQQQIRKLIYHVRYEYMTLNNAVLGFAAVIAISWAWASVNAVQRNYELQKEVDDKRRQSMLVQLETDNLQFEQHYYQSHEYLTLEAKRRLGLAEAGERVLVLPANTAATIAGSKKENTATAVPVAPPPPPPLQQWIDFLFNAKPQN